MAAGECCYCNIIEKKLKQKRDQERHNVMKLEWQKAELERQIANAKKNKCGTVVK